MKRKMLTLLSMSFLPQAVMAESTSITKYLMNEPVSMMDWGIYQIDRKLNSDDINGMLATRYGLLKKTAARAEYDWDKNLIRISYSVAIDPKRTQQEKHKKEICGGLLKRLRTSFGVDTKGKLMVPSEISHYFRHRGFLLRREPKDFAREIANVTEFQVSIIYDDFRKPNSWFRVGCEGGLLGRNILYTDMPFQ